jgi:hypothetical protein
VTNQTGLCGAGALARERLAANRLLRKMNSISIAIIIICLSAIARAFVLVTATLQEVFDESAYQRFLFRGNLSPSVESYAAFMAEHETRRARRPRCC